MGERHRGTVDRETKGWILVEREGGWRERQAKGLPPPFRLGEGRASRKEGVRQGKRG